MPVATSGLPCLVVFWGGVPCVGWEKGGSMRVAGGRGGGGGAEGGRKFVGESGEGLVLIIRNSYVREKGGWSGWVPQRAASSNLIFPQSNLGQDFFGLGGSQSQKTPRFSQQSLERGGLWGRWRYRDRPAGP